jgi:hypothetical protein
MQLVMDDHLQMIQAARKIDVQNVSVLVDLSLHEIADHLFGGDYDAGSKRGSVALGVKLHVADSARSPIRLIGLQYLQFLEVKFCTDTIRDICNLGSVAMSWE